MENKKLKCPACNKGFLEEIISDYVTYAKDGNEKIQITVKNLKREICPICKEEYLGTEALDRVEEEKYRALNLLTPDQLKNIRKNLSLTQTEMANLLSVGEKSYFRWENGLSVQNKSIDKYIRLVYEHPENIRYLKELEIGPKTKDYEKQELEKYFDSLASIEATEEDLIAQVAHGVTIPEDKKKKIEEIIKEYLDNKKHDKNSG